MYLEMKGKLTKKLSKIVASRYMIFLIILIKIKLFSTYLIKANLKNNDAPARREILKSQKVECEFLILKKNKI